MSEQMLLEARTPAKARRVPEPLRRALAMPYLKTADAKIGSVDGNDPTEQPKVSTYRLTGMSRAALNQVQFRPGKA